MRSWLKEARERQGLSQKEVASMVGITPQHYNFIENGQRGSPDKNNTEKKIAETLGFDWKLFFEDDTLKNT